MRDPVLGIIDFDVTDILGIPLPARAVLTRSGSETQTVLEIPEGKLAINFAPGEAEVSVYVYYQEVPYMVDVRKISVRAGGTTYIPISLLEGSSSGRGLDAFDRDFDLVLDSTELKAGTEPADPTSFPGAEPFEWDSEVLSAEAGWYRGELQAYSTYGSGSESVKELVRRAERLDLDFLAITDRGTLAAALDPAFKSKSVVLIPAMEWGSEARGVALIYSPGTMPRATDSFAEAQAMSILVQAQGGIFAVAHPCFPTAPWQWGLRYVNAIQVWCRDWGQVPPTTLGRFTEDWVTDRHEGKLVHTIARAGATEGRSANGQATLFWDLELSRGLQAGAIAGSRTANRRVPMAEPVTYVYAREKSRRGILDGLRRGRTMVARNLAAPMIHFTADILDDGEVEAMVGDTVPLREPTRFFVAVNGAEGMRLEVLLNGLPIRSKWVETDKLTYSFLATPKSYGVYRARLIEVPEEPGFDVIDMVAMTSPIYAQEVVFVDEEGNELSWVEIQSDYVDPEELEGRLPSDPEAYELRPREILE